MTSPSSKQALCLAISLATGSTAFAANIFTGATDSVYKATSDNTNVGLTNPSAGTYVLTNNSGSDQGAYIFGNFASTALSNVGESITLSFTATMPANIGTPFNFSLGGARGVTLTSADTGYDGFERSYAGFKITNNLNNVNATTWAWNGGPAGNPTQDRNLTGASSTSLGGSTTGGGSDRLNTGRTADFTFQITRQTSSFEIGGSISVNGGNGVQNYTTYSSTPSGNDFQLTDGFTSFALGTENGNVSNQIDSGDSLTFSNIDVTFTPVPEPSAAILGGLGALLMLSRRRVS